MSTLPVSDEKSRRDSMAQLNNRWAEVDKLMLEAETGLYTSLQPGVETTRAQHIVLLEKRLEEIDSALSAMHGVIQTEDQLHLYLGKIQVGINLNA